MANTLFFGKVYLRFNKLPSTNDYALGLLGGSETTGLTTGSKSRPPEGTVIRADSQSAGRGQFGSRWSSAPNENLLFSLILYPTWLAVVDQFYLNMALSLGVLDAVGGGRPPATVKWPNDLYLGPHKAAGLLIQNTISGNCLSASVVGIGLNVNQLDFGPDLPNATSLASSFDQDFDLDAVGDTLLECLERRYLQLKAGRLAALKKEYEANLYRRDLPTRFERTANGEGFEGIIRGVTAVGRLQVETGKGDVETFDLKEMRMLPVVPGLPPC